MIIAPFWNVKTTLACQLASDDNSTGLVYTRHGSAQSEGLPCSASFEKSPCLLAHTESQPEGMVVTTSKNIRHDPQTRHRVR